LLKVEDPHHQTLHSRDRDRDRDREQQAFKPMQLVRKSAGTSQAKAIQNLVAGESGVIAIIVANSSLPAICPKSAAVLTQN